MKINFLILICFHISLPLESRLIPKYTESTTEAKSVDLSSSRVTRSIYEDDSGQNGQSKEHDFGTEYTTAEKKQLLFTVVTTTQTTRVVRESQTESPSVKITINAEAQTTEKDVMVKKPIPKFTEIDYDDDFQSKVLRSKMKISDSSEHEDEDFNVDDYDFDINHDEYSGRGKPLEPRVKDKRILEQTVDPETESTPVSETQGTSAVRDQNKLVAIKVLNKRNDDKTRTKKRASPNEPKSHPKKGSYNKEDYYDDETSTSTVSPNVDKESDSEEEHDYMKEMKSRAIRASAFKPVSALGEERAFKSKFEGAIPATHNKESPFISEPLLFKWF